MVLVVHGGSEDRSHSIGQYYDAWDFNWLKVGDRPTQVTIRSGHTLGIMTTPLSI